MADSCCRTINLSKKLTLPLMSSRFASALMSCQCCSEPARLADHFVKQSFGALGIAVSSQQCEVRCLQPVVGITTSAHRSPVFCAADIPPVDADRLAARPSMNLVSTQHALQRSEINPASSSATLAIVVSIFARLAPVARGCALSVQQGDAS